MDPQNMILHIEEQLNQVTLSLKKPSARYIDEFLGLNCAADLIDLKLFRSAKEISESFGCYNAVRRSFWSITPPDRDDVAVICVGDGIAPATASTFAFRTRWTAVSVDPLLRVDNYPAGTLKRVEMMPCKIEECDYPLQGFSQVIVACVHLHASLKTVVEVVRKNKGNLLGLVSIPCCVLDDLDFEPHMRYHDWGIWSPKREVHVYRFQR